MGLQKLVLIGILWLLAGMVGSFSVSLWQRHNGQHAQVERLLVEQERINREFAQAINALAQRK